MKRIFLTLFLVLCMCGLANAQVKSLIQAATSPDGQISGNFKYHAMGTQDDTKYETQAESRLYGIGEFPSVVIYKNGAGSYESESLMRVGSGFLNVMDKVGSSTLVTFTDTGNDKIIRGVLDQSAAGVEARIRGYGGFGSAFQTAGGLQMSVQAHITEDGHLNIGAIKQITEGFGPGAGQEGVAGSSVTSRWEEHISVSGNPFTVSYSVSMNPSSFPVVPIP